MSAEVGRTHSGPADPSPKPDLTEVLASDENSPGQAFDPDVVRFEAAVDTARAEDGAQRDSKGPSGDSNEGSAENAEEEECGFCLFMKSGPCGKRFALWEECVEDAETIGDNIVEKCWQTTQLLKQCMEMNPEYYGPVLQAEKSLQEDSAAEGTSVAEPQATESEGTEEQYTAA